MNKHALRTLALGLGLAFVATSASANAPAWGDKMRAMLAKREAAAATQPVAAPKPSVGAVTLMIGTDGSMVAVAPTPAGDRAAAEPVPATATGGQ